MSIYTPHAQESDILSIKDLTCCPLSTYFHYHCTYKDRSLYSLTVRLCRSKWCRGK